MAHLMEKQGVPNRKLASSLSGLGAMGFPVSTLLFIQMPQIPIRDGKGGRGVGINGSSCLWGS